MEKGGKNKWECHQNIFMQGKRMSNWLDGIGNNTWFFQGLINIWTPHYHEVGISPPFVSTSVKENMTYAFPTSMVNIGLLSTCHSYGCLIHLWMQATRSNQAHERTSTNLDQAISGIPTLKDKPTTGNTLSLRNDLLGTS